jgi:hypothetical protein
MTVLTTVTSLNDNDTIIDHGLLISNHCNICVMSEHFLAPSLMGLTHGTMLTMNVSWIPRLFINKEPIFKFKMLIEVLLSLNRYLTTEKKHKNGRKHRINSTFSGTPYHSEKKGL